MPVATKPEFPTDMTTAVQNSAPRSPCVYAEIAHYRPMTAMEFRDLRIAAGFSSQQAAAEFLHRSVRTIHGWENGKSIDPLAVKCLRLMVQIGKLEEPNAKRTTDA